MKYPCFEEPQKKATLIFNRKELIYDASNCSFVESDVMPDEESHRKHQIADIAQAGNIDRVTRVLNTSFTECVEMLYPHTKEEISDETEVFDDKLEEPEQYEINLILPQSFSKTTLKLLKSLIHDYLVCCVLADWMGLTNNPQSQQKWIIKSQDLETKIRIAMTRRRKRIRRPLNPF